MKFTKMHGAGNDYVYVNCFEENVENPNEVAIKVSDRHFGIGSDGLILVCPSEVADVRMRMFNADGSEGKMCGNGSRCVAKFAYDYGIVKKDEISLETLSGIKYIKVYTENGKVTSATVNMGEPILKGTEIPTTFDKDLVVGEQLEIDGGAVSITCVSMGNPHCIIFTNEKVEDLDLPKIGPKYEFNSCFPERINTEFVNIIDNNTLKMRVWERGSGETLACGTGACAVAVAAILNDICKKDEDITIILVGGELKIKWDSKTNEVFMTGPATTVFTGEIII